MRVKFALLLPLLTLVLASTNAFAADPIEEKAKLCTTCHGEKGIPQLKTTPVIWGQNAGYLFLQLRDFKSGTRKNDLMSPIAAIPRSERTCFRSLNIFRSCYGLICSSHRRPKTSLPRQ